MISSTRSSVAACQLPVACISLIRNGLASSRFTMSSTVVLLLRQVSAIVPVAVLQIAHGGGLVRLAGGLGKGGVDEDGRIAGWPTISSATEHSAKGQASRVAN